MIGHDVLSKVEPEFGKLGQNSAFFLDIIFQDNVESGNSIGGYHNDAITDIIHFTNLA